MVHDKLKTPSVIWRQPDGEPVTCYDKIAILNDNLKGLRQECQDVLEDALLMGCDEKQAREVLSTIINELENPFK